VSDSLYSWGWYWNMNSHNSVILSWCLGLGLWCLMPLSAIFQISWQSVLLVEETRVPGETLSHNVVSSTPRRERDSNSQHIGDSHWLHRTIRPRQDPCWCLVYFDIFQIKIRAIALRCLREILRHQPRRFCDYAELTTLRILEAHKDPDWRVRNVVMVNTYVTLL
jgi:hypothetical protein